MKKWIGILSLLCLAGCYADVTSPSYSSTCKYGTVIAMDGNQLSIQMDDASSLQETIRLSKKIPVIKDTLTIPYKEIAKEDRLLLTYTNGILTVIEVLE